MQKFYNRETEVKALRDVTDNIEKTKGQLSVVVGKRRVGKTRLLKEAFFEQQHGKTLYFFISRKSEPLLVTEFTEVIRNELGAKFFQPSSLKDIVEYLLDYATQKPLTVIIDEFQDIQRVNASLFADIQNLWDASKHRSMMHLVCCGSLYNLMTTIFKEQDEPLLNRDDRFFRIKPLKPSFIKMIMEDQGLFSASNMLQWWCLSGGIPKYLEWLSLAHKDRSTFNHVISGSSPFIKEGAHRLVEDFGSEHQIYFDILNAISRGYTSRSQIQSVVEPDVALHLEKLEKNFNVVTRVKPISSKEFSRDSRFEIDDPFLKFWFKFIHSNKSAVEMDNFEYILSHIERDFKTFSGQELESLFKAILAESGRYNRIGGFWNKKGTNEIDIVAINELETVALIAEVKRSQARYNENLLIDKSQELIRKMNLHHYTISYRGFSLNNLENVMDEFL